LGGESKGKEPRRVPVYITTKSQGERSQNRLKKIAKKKSPKNTKKENREELKQALRNHAKSSIHTMKVHTSSSFYPVILPSHKISP
jgi:hypothetical protein